MEDWSLRCVLIFLVELQAIPHPFVEQPPYTLFIVLNSLAVFVVHELHVIHSTKIENPRAHSLVNNYIHWINISLHNIIGIQPLYNGCNLLFPHFVQLKLAIKAQVLQVGTRFR
jgi:hypothetical protein